MYGENCAIGMRNCERTSPMRPHPRQAAFNFDAEAGALPQQDAPETPARTLDAEGHRWYAALARHGQEFCIAKAREWPEHGAELAALSKQWAAQADAHQAKAFALEPQSRHL